MEGYEDVEDGEGYETQVRSTFTVPTVTAVGVRPATGRWSSVLCARSRLPPCVRRGRCCEQSPGSSLRTASPWLGVVRRPAPGVTRPVLPPRASDRAHWRRDPEAGSRRSRT